MDPLLLPIPDGCEVIGVGRSKMYELIAEGQIETVTIGSRRLIPATALEAYAARLIERQRNAA